MEEGELALLLLAGYKQFQCTHCGLQMLHSDTDCAYDSSKCLVYIGNALVVYEFAYYHFQCFDDTKNHKFTPAFNW